MFGKTHIDNKEALTEAYIAMIKEPEDEPEPMYRTNETLETDPQLKEYWRGNLDTYDENGYKCLQLDIDDELAKAYFNVDISQVIKLS